MPLRGVLRSVRESFNVIEAVREIVELEREQAEAKKIELKFTFEDQVSPMPKRLSFFNKNLDDNISNSIAEAANALVVYSDKRRI